MFVTCFIVLVLLPLIVSKTFELPKISYYDLVGLNTPDLPQLLIKFGTVQITDIPGFVSAKQAALEDAPSCLSTLNTKGKKEMEDGTIRISVAAETKNGLRDVEMSNKCGKKAKTLRDLIDLVSIKLFAALDHEANLQGGMQQGKIMEPSYSTISDLMLNGNHLEHLHVYFPSPESQKLLMPSSPTIDFHIDHGLMIAMTTGYFRDEKNVPSKQKNGLFLKLKNDNNNEDEVFEVVADDNSLILLMGEGAEHWLTPAFGKPFRAVPHALRLDSSSFSNRAWFGKMFLPPSDAILPTTLKSYDEHRRLLMEKKEDYIPLVCRDSNHKTFEENHNCVDGEIYCWMQCLPKPDKCDGPPVCYDAIKQRELYCYERTKHHYNASVTCDSIFSISKAKDTENSKPSVPPFCRGATTMDMEGFFSSFFSPDYRRSCINLWFMSFTLNTEFKFFIGWCFVFGLGVLIQYLHLLRRNKRLSREVYSFYYFFEFFLGYLLMLVAMTYNIELFLAACLGTAAGFYIWHAKDPETQGNVGHTCCPPEEVEPLNTANHPPTYQSLELHTNNR